MRSHRLERILLLLTLLVASCADADRHDYKTPVVEDTTSVLTPDQTVMAMLRAYFDKQILEYHSHVSAEDRAAKTIEELQAELAPNTSDLVTDYLFRFSQLNVDSTRVFGDSAYVWISALSPDMGSVVQQALVVERNLGPETDLETKLSILRERLKLRGSPQEWHVTRYSLTQEDGQWKVRIGWANQDSPAGRIYSD